MAAATAREVNLFAVLITAANDKFVSRLAALGLGSVSQAACVATLKGYPGDSVDQIAETLGITGSGATRLLAQLVRAGIVRKGQGQDRRSVALTLTRRGEVAAEAVLQARQECFGSILDGLDVDEVAVLARLTERMLAGFGGEENSWADHTCRFCDFDACPQASCPVACSQAGSS